MWWKKKINHLPFSEGPYVPGCADLMTEYSRDGCFVRLFYPTSLSHIQNHTKKWIPWLPNDKYLEGLARVLQIWKILIRFVLWFYSGRCHIPVVRNADLKLMGRKLPIVIFSHGLGASRFLCSTVCMELASHGFLVAAMEHRDKSACTTFYYKSEERFKDSSPSWLNFKVVRFGTAHHYSSRKKQITRRVDECKRVVDLLVKLNDGIPVQNVISGDFNLNQFRGRLNMTNITMMGHSFGGATALLALGNDPRLKYGVILDAWTFPLKEETDLNTKIKQPLIFINTETFHITSNFNVLKKYVDCASDLGEKQRTCFTIRNTTHESQTDTPFLAGYWLNWKMKKLPIGVAIKINNQLILDFLKEHIGIEHDVDVSLLTTQSHNIIEGLLEWK